MRFEPEIQPLFADLCEQLKIELVPFPPPSSGLSSGNPKLAADEYAGGKPLPTDDLLELGVFRMFGEDPRTQRDPPWLKTLDLAPSHRPRGWKHPLEPTLDKNKKWTAENIRVGATVRSSPLGMQGTPWWELGFWNALSEELSHRAVIHIRDTGTFYHLIPDNPNAVEWAIFWLRLFQLKVLQGKERIYLHTIPTGVRTIVERIEDEFSQINFKPSLSHEVVGLMPGSPKGKIRLKVNETNGRTPRRVVPDPEFDHVILALPRSPLLRLSENFPEDIRSQKLNSVIGFPLLKAFLVVRNPWWKNKRLPAGLTDDERELMVTGKIPIMSHRNAASVPTRELHYFLRKDTTPPTGMVMLYTDHPATEYWKTLVQKDGAAHTSAAVYEEGWDYPRLKGALVHYLGFDRRRFQKEAVGSQTKRSLEEVNVANAVTAYAIRDWSCEPFGAGCHAWKPGVQSAPVRARLPAFALEDTDQRIKNVHICGEAYSDYQGFVEGALQTAADVVEAICGHCPICD